MSKAAVQAGLGAAVVAGLAALAVTSGWVDLAGDDATSSDAGAPAVTEAAADAAPSVPEPTGTTPATTGSPAAPSAPPGDELAGTPGQGAGAPTLQGGAPQPPVAPGTGATALRADAPAPLPRSGGAPGAPTGPGQADAGQAVASALPPAPEMPAPRAAPSASGLAMPGSDDATPAVPMIVPRFDLVRAEPGGSTLVAGSAEPGAEVTLLVDGSAHDSATAAGDGTFVIFADLPPRGLAQVLTLRSRAGSRSRASEEEVIIAPAAPQMASATQAPREPDAPGAGAAPELSESATATAPGQATGADLSTPAASDGSPDVAGRPAPAPRVAEPGAAPGAPPAGGDLALETAPGTDDPAPDSQSVARAAAPGTETAPREAEGLPPVPDAEVGAAPDATEAPTIGEGVEIAAEGNRPDLPTAPSDTTMPERSGDPTVLVSRPEGVEVLQAAPLGPDEVALDAIGYDARGEVFLSGRGNEAAFLRIYLDNTPVTTSRIREDGRWRVELPQVDTGTYTLRVDQLDESGEVIARVESPFQREAREILAAATQGSLGPIAAITVQPGDTLWAISRTRYGEGIAYVRVYDANADQIRDPDLIYPGQVFSLPDDEG